MRAVHPRPTYAASSEVWGNLGLGRALHTHPVLRLLRPAAGLLSPSPTRGTPAVDPMRTSLQPLLPWPRLSRALGRQRRAWVLPVWGHRRLGFMSRLAVTGLGVLRPCLPLGRQWRRRRWLVVGAPRWLHRSRCREPFRWPPLYRGRKGLLRVARRRHKSGRHTGLRGIQHRRNLCRW